MSTLGTCRMILFRKKGAGLCCIKPCIIYDFIYWVDAQGSDVGGIPGGHEHRGFTEPNVRWEEVAICKLL